MRVSPHTELRWAVCLAFAAAGLSIALAAPGILAAPKVREDVRTIRLADSDPVQVSAAGSAAGWALATDPAGQPEVWQLRAGRGSPRRVNSGEQVTRLIATPHGVWMVGESLVSSKRYAAYLNGMTTGVTRHSLPVTCLPHEVRAGVLGETLWLGCIDGRIFRCPVKDRCRVVARISRGIIASADGEIWAIGITELHGLSQAVAKQRIALPRGFHVLSASALVHERLALLGFADASPAKPQEALFVLNFRTQRFTRLLLPPGRLFNTLSASTSQLWLGDSVDGRIERRDAESLRVIGSIRILTKRAGPKALQVAAGDRAIWILGGTPSKTTLFQANNGRLPTEIQLID
jgi:hypothetical protein